ncbi:hypothetical protein B0T18DRAFT_390629 [Schizothecium vesticola]|uniref:Uncharacterized protein n=1 Tax=Schizothecium vesticola TaxID=314040 RepID=A0AA40EV55_9PEZI|nr:hypothetical protein B0T18DRAFT_390629 [Schizothecium vesticola]
MDRSRSETIPFAAEPEDGDPSLMKIGIPHVSYWQLPDEDGYTYSAKYQAQIDEKGATSQVLVNYRLNRVAGWQNTLKVYDIDSDDENDEPGWHTSFIKDITAKAKKSAKSKGKASTKGKAKANADADADSDTNPEVPDILPFAQAPSTKKVTLSSIQRDSMVKMTHQGYDENRESPPRPGADPRIHHGDTFSSPNHAGGGYDCLGRFVVVGPAWQFGFLQSLLTSLEV